MPVSVLLEARNGEDSGYEEEDVKGVVAAGAELCNIYELVWILCGIIKSIFKRTLSL